MEIALQLNNVEGVDHVSYVGPINEEAEVHLRQILPQLGANCVFNFRRVASVNSCGVRAWINFMREAQKDRQIGFEECPPEVVMQINMIPSFRGEAKINSVYGHFICSDCGNEQDILFVAGKNLPTSADSALLGTNCTKCQSLNTEMDELEEEYFAFVDAQ